MLVHHASAVIAAIVIFALVARLAIWLLPHGLVRKVVVVIDDVVLIGLLLYFGYEMFVYLWNRRPPVQRNAASSEPLSPPSRLTCRHRSRSLLARSRTRSCGSSPSRGNRRLAGISLS